MGRGGAARATRAALLAVVVLTATAGLSRPAGASVPAGDPGTTPDTQLDRLIHSDQVALVARPQIVTLDRATSALTAADRALVREERTVGTDEQVVTAAGAALARAATAAEAAHAQQAAAAQVHAKDLAHRRGDHAALQQIAVAWYTGGSAQGSNPSSLAVTPVIKAADAALRRRTGRVEGALAAATVATAASGQRLASARDGASRAARRRHGAAAQLSSDRTALTVAHHDVGGDRAAIAAGRTAVRAATLARDAVVSRFDGLEGGGAAPVPSIVGASALDPTQMAAWFALEGYVDTTKTPIAQLARWYIAEGRATDVRGDIAFAQAVLETGGFASPDAVERHNFAGIGYCDTCTSGLRLPSAQAGVTAQLQLLRTFADASFDAPPVLSSLDPATQYDRGCCTTWNSLTGKWATSSTYGAEVLEIYAGMLGYAVATQPPASS